MAAEAVRRYPRGGPAQAGYMLMQLAARGLTLAALQVPCDAIARYAIDRWAGRDPGQVAEAAYAC